MANRFVDSFNSPQGNPDISSQFNSFAQDPYGTILANQHIDIPQQYRGSYKQAAMYCLQSLPQVQQNSIFQKANMLKQMLGMR